VCINTGKSIKRAQRLLFAQVQEVYVQMLISLFQQVFPILKLLQTARGYLSWIGKLHLSHPAVLASKRQKMILRQKVTRKNG